MAFFLGGGLSFGGGVGCCFGGCGLGMFEESMFEDYRENTASPDRLRARLKETKRKQEGFLRVLRSEGVFCKSEEGKKVRMSL